MLVTMSTKDDDGQSWFVSVLQEKHGGSDTKCPLTVKILDAVKGTPAGPVALTVYQKAADGGWTHVANGCVQRETHRVENTSSSIQV